MKNKLSSINQMLFLSITFTMLLLLIRIAITHQLTYIFYSWNIFLAIIPLWFSKKIARQKILKHKSYLLLVGWLLFFPNAPYIITDLFHYTERPPIPFWYDLLIVTSAAWNGLMLGLISLMQVEQFLLLHLKPLLVKVFVILSFILCGYGIYIGRFLRFNSWDIVTDLDGLFFASFDRIFHPFHHLTTWAFSILFAMMLALFYYSIKATSRFLTINYNTH